MVVVGFLGLYFKRFKFRRKEKIKFFGNFSKSFRFYFYWINWGYMFILD